MRGKPDKFYKLGIVDPPYGINVANMAYTQEDFRPVKQKNGQILRVRKAKYSHGEWDKYPPPVEYFNELFRITEHQIIWGINYFDIIVGPGRIKWDKCVPDGVSFNRYEHAYCSLIDYEITFTYLWAGMMQAKSLSEPTTQRGNKKLNEKRIHPTQKPIDLYRWMLYKFAQPGWNIYDSHGGAMGLSIAAWDLGFDLDICEIDKQYFDDGYKRYKTHTMQKRLFFG